MTNQHDPTDDLIRRALHARAEETTVSPDALGTIRTRSATPRWVRPVTYGAVAAAVALVAGLAFFGGGSDDASEIDPVTTTSSAPDATTTTLPDTTTTVPDGGTNTTLPVGTVDDGLAIWPTDGAGETSAEAAARGWIENVLGIADPQLHRAAATVPDAPEHYLLSFTGEEGEPLAGAPGVDIFVASPDAGTHWFVERAETPGLSVDLVEHNGAGDTLRVTGQGQAFEGTGLLWVDDQGPTVVSLGSTDTDHFSVVVPYDGGPSVRIRLETARTVDGEVPQVHAFAVEPAGSATDVRVDRVADDDVLNVRTGAGVDNDIAFTLSPDATGLTHTGETAEVDGETWWEVTSSAGDTGWANARFLTVWREVVPGSALAEEMIEQSRFLLSAFGDPRLDPILPAAHPNGTQVGGIGVFADAPTPFTTVDLRGDEVIDWDPFPGETAPCGDPCLRTVAEFLGVRERDVTDAVFTIGPDDDATSQLMYFTGRDAAYYEHHMTVVAYVPPTSDEVLDWRRYTFAFDLVDGTPTISEVWVWGWTP
jgi:hypothetical protein